MSRGALLSIGLLAFLASCPGTTDDENGGTTQPSFTYSSGVTAEFGMAQDAASPVPTWTNLPAGTIVYSLEGSPQGVSVNDATGVVTVAPDADVRNTAQITVTATVGDSAYTAKITITVTAKDIADVQGFSISIGDQTVTGSQASTFTVTINNTRLTAGTDYGLSIEKKDGAPVTAVTIDNSGLVSIANTIGTGDTGTYTVKAAGKTNYTGETTVDFVLTVVYSIGDTGPAGGKIFYVNTDPAIVEWTYLEAAPSALPGRYKWGNTTTEVRTTGTAIGTGESNTAAIVTALDTAGFTENYAAKACVDSTLGGKDDWFLPSKDELNELYTQIGSVGWKLSWSSSEASLSKAWTLDSDNGHLDDFNAKSNDFSVRAVRAF